MLRVRQTGRNKAFLQVAAVRVILGAKLFGCSHIMAHSLVRRFEKTVISVDAQD